MDNFFNNARLLDIIIKWKYHLLAVGIAAILLSMLFSSPIFIKPLFKSYAVVYPSNTSPYSDENETEQMIQILGSKDIRDSVIQRFNLSQHWEIDSTYIHFMTTMIAFWDERVKIGKTPNDAVEIAVYDPDPKIACDMVSAIIHYYDIKVRSLHKEKFGEVLGNFKFILVKKSEFIDSLKNELTMLGTKYGLLDFGNQTKEVMRAYFQNSGSRIAQQYIKNMTEHGGEYQKIAQLMSAEAGQYSTLKLDYDRALLNYNRNYTHSNLITKPFPADKKSSPVRWLIVALSTFAALLLALIIAGIIENRNQGRLNAARQV